MNCRSRSSTLLVNSGAAWASVPRPQRGHVEHVGGQPGGDELLDRLWVGTSTLPPMCPHFLYDDNWSSNCTAAAPASIMDFISSKALSTPPKPASASATMGAYHCGICSPIPALCAISWRVGGHC